MKWLLSLIDRIMAKLYPVTSLDNDPIVPVEVVPTTPPEALKQPPSETLDWSTPKGAYHATRVTCDNLGLGVSAKNLICACIFQESRFNNKAKNVNKDGVGRTWSTDWGIVQINDYWHIGPNKDFPSVEYVLANPDKMVEYMINTYKGGQLRLWASYSSKAYKQWLLPLSPMWDLSA